MKQIKQVGTKYTLKTMDTSEYNELTPAYHDLEHLEDAERKVREMYPKHNYHCEFYSATVFAIDVYEDEAGHKFYPEPVEVWNMSYNEWLRGLN
ncbi:MAG: hypothetical protein J6M02_04330 [Clostridia bacterium]|nr:hypothetical protein [Clostridia bacterium]